MWTLSRAWLLGVALCLAAASAGCRSEERTLARPNVVMVTGDGSILVSDFQHHRVVSFDPGGRFLGSFGHMGIGEGELWLVWSMQELAAGRILVLQQRPVDLERDDTLWEVKIFRHGEEQEAHQLRVPSKGEDAWMDSVATLPDGRFVVASTGLSALVLFDGAWRHQETWSAPRGGPPFDGPGFVLAHGDRLWVVEENAHRIRALTLDGRQVLAFGTEGSGPGEILFPQGLALCPGKWLAVADLGNFRVQRFTLDGRYMDSFEPEPARPDVQVQLLSIGVSRDCARLYVVDSKGNRVLVTSPTGQLITTIHTIG